MNNYELTIVLDGKAGSATKKRIAETLKKVLSVLKGTVKESKEWGVKDLAYKIKKSDKGLFLFFEIELDPKSAKTLDEKLRMDADIIRYLLINKEK